MKMMIFSVFDSKATAYLQPFFSPTIGSAERSFEDAARDSGHQFCKHAADYTLFKIGEFNELSGEISGLDVFVKIVNAVKFKGVKDEVGNGS